MNEIQHHHLVSNIIEKWRLLEYVKLPGYRFSYRDRYEKRVGGVGVYTKDCKTYKIGKDDDSFEHFGN